MFQPAESSEKESRTSKVSAQSPLSSFEILQAGTNADVLWRTLGPVISQEKEYLLRVIANMAGASLGEFGFVAGQVRTLTRLEQMFSMAIERASQAKKKLEEEHGLNH